MCLTNMANDLDWEYTGIPSWTKRSTDVALVCNVHMLHSRSSHRMAAVDEVFRQRRPKSMMKKSQEKCKRHHHHNRIVKGRHPHLACRRRNDSPERGKWKPDTRKKMLQLLLHGGNRTHYSTRFSHTLAAPYLRPPFELFQLGSS